MRSKDQVNEQVPDSLKKQVPKSDSKVSTPLKLSYAELLCTASTIVHLDHTPLPWFSDEIRMSDDPRVKWLDLSLSEHVNPHQDKLISSADSTNPMPKSSETQSSTKVEDDNAAISGHYLDHIEAVQERDQRASHKRKRRSSKSKAKTKQTQKLQQSPKLPANKAQQPSKASQTNKESDQTKGQQVGAPKNKPETQKHTSETQNTKPKAKSSSTKQGKKQADSTPAKSKTKPRRKPRPKKPKTKSKT